MKQIIFGLLLLSFGLNAHALDRVQLIQLKIHSSLASILPPSDFLVIVNRLDTLDDGGASQVIDGSFKPLPGLNLGVDSRGEIIRQDHDATSYNGAVAINVVIESKVKPETYKAIEKLLPDIAGGFRDDDEIKMSRESLRQPPIPLPSQMQQYAPPQPSPQQQNSQTQENIKFLALILLTGGLFFWFMSKFNMPGQKDKNAGSGSDRASQDDEKKKHDIVVQPEDFAVLDPEAVALFLLKGIRDKNENVWDKWIKNSPAKHQREVFKHLPSWILSYFQDLSAPKTEEGANKTSTSLHELFNEMALIEQSFKLPLQKKKAFLQWFPAQALRYVPRNYQRALSHESKRTLWAMRPDLGNFVKVEDIKMEEVMREPTAEAIVACVEELFSFPSVAFESRHDNSTGMVDRWISLINQLNEFSPITSQIEQAQTKLNPADFQKLLSSTAHLRTPFGFSVAAQKDWLRIVEPHDYYWWLSLAKETPTWDLKQCLRPMRWAMFSQAAEEEAAKNWSEEERKRASERVLAGFREILNTSGRDSEREVA